MIGLFFSENNSFSGKDKIAVLNIDTVIIQSKDYLKSIKKIRENKTVKAVLVRINSPGGAVGPSQEIFSELEALGKEMPVVASMDNVAASGGYYIACAAEKIYANPGTITGSIGVIAQFANYKELLEWAKVDVEVIKSGNFKDIGSPFKKMLPEEKLYIQKLIENVHTQFKKVVSEKRGIDYEKLSTIADGRIYTGEQAKEINLVDELGNFTAALNKAAELAGIEGEPEILEFPKETSPILDLLLSKSQTSARLLNNPIKTSFGLFYIANIGY
ncbi:MAG: signal peptide peptidase SppA [Thermodesulfobacteriota bacterium]